MEPPSMEEVLEDRFQRVDTALNTLIESVTRANPSVSAAHDLVAADDSLSEGLEQREYSLYRCLCTHIKLIQYSYTAPI